jgi:hypothetical protein
VGDGGDVFDADNLDAHGGERADGRLATRAGPTDEDVDLAHPVLHGPLGAGFGGQLGGEGASTLPSGSAIDTIVLLNELLMCATP